MIEHNTTAALKLGYNVILEGVLNVKLYQFHLDVSLEQTVDRGKTKPVSALFTAEQLEQWYPASRVPYHNLEVLVPEHFSSNDSFEFILDTLGGQL